jgi:hypothetical protein
MITCSGLIGSRNLVLPLPGICAREFGPFASKPAARGGRAGGQRTIRNVCPANGADAKLRGQGPRPEAEAARAMPACESRDAWRVTQRGF